MGFLSGLFGGGKTTVQQQAANTTEVGVEVTVQNLMDLSGLTAVLEKLGLMQVASTDAATQATAKSANDLIGAIKEYGEIKQKQETAYFEKVLPWLRAIGAAAVLFLLTKTYINWKKA